VCQKWFAKFRSGNFSIQDVPRSGWPVKIDQDKVRTLIDTNKRYTTREIADVLQISKTSVANHLHQLGYISRLDMWVPHELSEAYLIKRISVSDSLWKREENDPFLKRMITGDEKWIVYNNIQRKRSWEQRNKLPQIISKPGLHPNKIMLSIWWDWKGVVFYELLPKNKMINLDVYCGQLDKLNAAIHKKRPELVNRKGVVFHHDNARPHTSLQTRQKLLELSWDILPHPPYSPDLAPSDYHLFRSLQNSLNGRRFTSEEDIKRHLKQFFSEKDKKFYERGIMKLPERWQKIVDQKGQYIID